MLLASPGKPLSLFMMRDSIYYGNGKQPDAAGFPEGCILELHAPLLECAKMDGRTECIGESLEGEIWLKIISTVINLVKYPFNLITCKCSVNGLQNRAKAFPKLGYAFPICVTN